LNVRLHLHNFVADKQFLFYTELKQLTVPRINSCPSDHQLFPPPRHSVSGDATVGPVKSVLAAAGLHREEEEEEGEDESGTTAGVTEGDAINGSRGGKNMGTSSVFPSLLPLMADPSLLPLMAAVLGAQPDRRGGDRGEPGQEKGSIPPPPVGENKLPPAPTPSLLPAPPLPLPLPLPPPAAGARRKGEAGEAKGSDATSPLLPVVPLCFCCCHVGGGRPGRRAGDSLLAGRGERGDTGEAKGSSNGISTPAPPPPSMEETGAGAAAAARAAARAAGAGGAPGGHDGDCMRRWVNLSAC
jgi:hypothetical protein